MEWSFKQITTPGLLNIQPDIFYFTFLKNVLLKEQCQIVTLMETALSFELPSGKNSSVEKIV